VHALEPGGKTSATTLALDAAGAAVHSPLATALFVLGRKARMHRSLVLRSAEFLFGGDDRSGWKDALDEVCSSGTSGAHPTTSTVAGNALDTTLGKWLYACVRARKPQRIIETGVASGVSSAVILTALARNGSGRLYSIDLPNNDTNRNYDVPGNEPGWVVPDALRDRWDLRIGPAQQLLPDLLDELRGVDMFFHDSDHSYSHMAFEFEQTLPYLTPGGVIVSDDINKNRSFQDFVAQHGLGAVMFRKSGCAVRRV
jgi:hypothetical protein